LILFGLRPGPTENATFMQNPVAVSGALADLRTELEAPVSLFMALTVAASGASLALRFRRARGIERQQVKWVASAAVLCAATFAAMLATNQSKLAQVLVVASLGALPVKTVWM
jgi:uncharacterized membrane protein